MLVTNSTYFSEGGSREFSESALHIASIPTISDFKQRVAGTSSRKRINQNQNEFCDANGFKRICGKNGEYIEGRCLNQRLIELKSFQFVYPKSEKAAYVRRQGSDYLLVFDDELFIARAIFNNIENMVEERFKKMKKELLQRMVITEIIKDCLLIERDSRYNPLISYLDEISDKTANYLNYAEDIFQVKLTLEKNWQLTDRSILNIISKNPHISVTFRNIFEKLVCAETNMDIRRKDFPNIIDFSPRNVISDLNQVYANCIKNHKQSLIDECCLFYSQNNEDFVQGIIHTYLYQVLYLSKDDMRLFSDMDNACKEQPFEKFYANLQSKFFQYVNTLNYKSSLKAVTPLTDPIYYILFKGFREIVAEIERKTNMTPVDLLKYNYCGNWQLADSIEWLQPSSLLNRSLEKQYRFMFLLMEYFEPRSHHHTKQFSYDFKLLQNTEWSPWMLQKQLVWMYFLDNAIAGIVKKEQMKWYESLVNGCQTFLTETGEQYESFRIISQTCARFIVQTCPYLSESVEKNDQDILTKQIDYINKAIRMKAFTNFRDLIDVYNDYWTNRDKITVHLSEKFPHGKFKDELNKISQGLLDILVKVLSCNVQPQEVIKYFRVFNEFVEDLDAVDYRWIVNRENVISVRDSYVIEDPEQFLRSGKPIPRHFVIEIIHELVTYIIKLFISKSWSDKDKVNAATDLISAIKKSFIYLSDQTKYLSYQTFKDESTKPFISVIENSLSYSEFSKRVDVIGESFWYLRKQDEINIEDALKLYEKENSCHPIGIMRTCYNTYLDKLNYYLTQTYSKKFREKIDFIVAEMHEDLQEQNFRTWDVIFKREVLLKVLAGLAAVWSILQSKDIGVTEKYLKPHCIQILGIIKLLSIDEDYKGIHNHLGQVLTGQGKSLVLGLLSALLALTNHKVRTVCYSKYLATRDQEDFAEFFKIFNIGDKIVYDTFEDMANDHLFVEVDGQKQAFRDLVKNRILEHSEEKLRKISNNNIDNTVLLIDEVDVLFSDMFYGNQYGACDLVFLSGLQRIQEMIWELALSGNNDEKAIYSVIESYINAKKKEKDSDLKEFNKYLSKRGQFRLLGTNSKAELIIKEYNNESFFYEQLITMIKNAIRVKEARDEDWIISNYIINDNGKIAYKNQSGIYCEKTYLAYNNIFVYLRMKKKNFDKKNYGYLIADCGFISYAKLPTEYPLILGVSGTLTTLNEPEKRAVENFFQIYHQSVMPSYFGRSKLRFSTSDNFAIANSEDEWHSKIFHEANSKMSSGTSVLVFFKTDIDIEKFRRRFSNKFDRLHVLTENSKDDEKKKFVEEAGIPKTITLATRGMGRGVDYKSSVAVEKSGGTHVIQTFLSLDVKEETQIKGRTARKDNNGSYELIICKEHLIQDGYIGKDDRCPSYEKLHELRTKKMNEIRSNDAANIAKADNNHVITMEFLKSFLYS